MAPSPEKPTRVLAVVHNKVLRDGLCCLIETMDGLELAATASTADDAVKRFVDSRPDVTWMDLDLPADSGLHAIRRIREIDPAAWIIALITHEDDGRGSEAMAAGASAVVAKHDIEHVEWKASRPIFSAPTTCPA